MAKISVKIKGLAELERAVKRNPKKTIKEIGIFFARSMAVYNRIIIRQPWEVGTQGGGVPVLTANLRQRHRREISKFKASIFVNENEVEYAKYVHEGTQRMRARPWLEFAKKKGQREINKLSVKMLEAIRNDLAK